MNLFIVRAVEGLEEDNISFILSNATKGTLEYYQNMLPLMEPKNAEKWEKAIEKTFQIGGKRIMPKVIVYSKSDCGGCEKVKQWLIDKGIAYETKTVIDPKVKDEVVELGYMSVPVTKIEKEDGSVVTLEGYNPEELEKHFGSNA
jgi:glutaredoxin